MARRLLLLLALAVGVTATAAGDADARADKKSAKKSKSKKKEKDKKHTKLKMCEERTVKKGKRSRRKRVCEYHAQFEGRNAAKSSLRTEPLERPSGDIWVKSENLQEELKVNIYAPDGGYDDAALAQLDEIFRCRRSNEVRAIDPRLYEQMSRVYDHFGGEKIELVSGFRFKERSSSRHWQGSAMDIRIKGHSINEIYTFAQTLDLGGMGVGIYPHSGFVHIDYRAPGEPSYRWTDYSYPDGEGKATAKRPPRVRKTRAHRPTS